METDDRPISALPSGRARALAFAAILVAGLSGALIGTSLVSIQCEGSCGTASGLGAIVGALAGGGGVAVVAVLVLRAMSEWRRTEDAEPGGHPDDPDVAYEPDENVGEAAQPASRRSRKPSA